MRGVRWLAGLGLGCGGVELTDGVPTNPNAACPAAEVQEFVVGMNATTELGRVVSIASASPSPPDVGDNSWVLTITDGIPDGITDGAGGPVGGLEVVVTPWMPLHNHGLVPEDYAGTEQSVGTYSVETFDLIMPGLWEFTIDLGAGDTVQFKFCAEG